MSKSALALAAALFGFPVSAQEYPPLPREQIIQAYKGGELDSVLIYIREGRAKPMFKDRNDSILAFKCLGVIYASDPVRREKGRYYFNMLLRLDPMASITDFYPSEVIRQVFKEVREEYMETHPELMVSMKAAGEAAPVPAATASDTVAALEKPASETASAPRKSRLGWWIAGGTVVAVGAGTATYFVLADDPSTKVYRIHD